MSALEDYMTACTAEEYDVLAGYSDERAMLALALAILANALSYGDIKVCYID